jgi:uncharacterized membrane protein YdbT with pleckstrin-like domain
MHSYLRKYLLGPLIVSIALFVAARLTVAAFVAIVAIVVVGGVVVIVGYALEWKRRSVALA